jgi:hypothetical protein
MGINGPKNALVAKKSRKSGGKRDFQAEKPLKSRKMAEKRPIAGISARISAYSRPPRDFVRDFRGRICHIHANLFNYREIR